MHSRRDWRIAEADRNKAALLAKEANIPRVLAHLLVLRGIETPEAACHFLDPDRARISDPFRMTDMARSVDRIQKARERGEAILVFGDYDVDGIVGTTILLGALRRFGCSRVDFAMPDRVTEGYGINPAQVEKAHADGVTLIITTDNGIAAFDAVDAANARGIDVIVTDHHPPGDTLPPAFAVINPKRESGEFPGRDLCGAGVAFKLAWALTGEQRDYDLAAVATVADMVPLTGENRELVAAGLRDLVSNARPGLSALVAVAGLRSRDIKSSDIAFQISPRINAAGRIGDPTTAVHLLQAESRAVADPLARALNDANLERRSIEDQIHKQVLAALDKSFQLEQRSVVLASTKWHAGVVGIVASRIQATHYRPVVLVAFDENGVGRGSARSVEGLNIAEALAECGQHLLTHGGHAAAAGLSVQRDSYNAFKSAFETAAGNRMPQGNLLRPLYIDAQVALSDIDAQLVQYLTRLEPVGTGNPSPVFGAFNVKAEPGSVRELKGGHIRLRVANGSAAHPAIGFRMGDCINELARAGSLDVAFTPEFNEWRGDVTVQLNLKDIRIPY